MKTAILAIFFILPFSIGFSQIENPLLMPAEDQLALDRKADQISRSVTADDSNSNDAYIRVWTLLDADVPSEQFGVVGKLSKKLGITSQIGSGESEFLVSNPYPYMLSGYAPIKPGNYKISLVDIDAKDADSLSSVEIEIKPSSFHTIMIERDGGNYSLKWMADSVSVSGDESSSGAIKVKAAVEGLIIYNSIPGASTALASEQPAVQKLVNSRVIEKITGLPRSIIPMKIATKFNDKIVNAEAEINLRDYTSLTCVVVKDIYGRIVPAVIPNAVVE